MTDPADRRIDPDELAVLARTSPSRIVSAREAGLLEPRADGTYRPGDIHTLRVLDAFLGSGIPLEALREANERGLISFASYDRLHADPGAPSDRTFGELLADAGPRGPLLGQIIAALGLAEPDHASPLPQADEDILLELVDIVETTRAPDLALRTARLLSDATRRATEAVLTVYGEAVERLGPEVVGMPWPEVNDRFLEPWNRYARLAPRLGGWLTARHLSDAIDAYSVEATEQYLTAGGFVPPRDETPPAIAFVDLAGFTRLAEERGDEPAARIALEFGQLAERVAGVYGGRVVKLLGDGVLLRFDGPAIAVDAVLALLAEQTQAGLPAGHAGIEAGPVIVRDGDVFGRTVNLASRIADVAAAGAVVLSASAAERLPTDGYRLESLGRVALKGIAEPVDLVRVTGDG